MYPNPNNFDECPIFRQGGLIIVKDIKYGVLSVMCDDCESEWKDPESALKCEQTLPRCANRVEDATIEEIKKQGWDKYFKHKL